MFFSQSWREVDNVNINISSIIGKPDLGAFIGNRVGFSRRKTNTGSLRYIETNVYFITNIFPSTPIKIVVSMVATSRLLQNEQSKSADDREGDTCLQNMSMKSVGCFFNAI